MIHRVALHGGGEYMPRDDRFLSALLRAAAGVRGSAGTAHPGDGADPTQDGRPGPVGTGEGTPVRITILAAAAARSRPDLAVENARRAFGRVAAPLALGVRVEDARILDRPDAQDPRRAEGLAAADIVHIAGGDPGHLLEVLEGTAADAALRAMLDRGGIVAGASAGAMALASWTWTTSGPRRALGIVPGVAVLPHFDAGRLRAWAAAVSAAGEGQEPGEGSGPGWLGLDEATGVLAEAGPSGQVRWRVAGPGLARWYRPGRLDVPAAVAADGELLPVGDAP